MDYISQLAAGLRRLGIRAGDTLLVHTSIKGLAAPGLTPDDIIHALTEVLTPEGTLLVPALSYSTVTRENPVFSLKDTPACIGALPERFRTAFAQCRSVHPTHSVCGWGRDALALTKDHFRDTTPVGRHSPFMRLPERGGKILMLGCGLRPNTFMHGVEEAAGASYPLDTEAVTYRIDDGKLVYQKSYLPHHFGALRQRYDRLGGLLSEPELAEGSVLGGTAYLIDAAAALRVGVEKIRETDKFFVE